jgi:hypothetical protein
MIPACGPGGDPKGGPSSVATGNSDLSTPVIDLSGGGASGPASTGGDGGSFSAQGGRPNRHGGDLEFHGFGKVPDPVTGEPNPVRDDVRNDGDGSGGNGVFTSD